MQHRRSPAGQQSGTRAQIRGAGLVAGAVPQVRGAGPTRFRISGMQHWSSPAGQQSGTRWSAGRASGIDSVPHATVPHTGRPTRSRGLEKQDRRGHAGPKHSYTLGARD
uniref:Uncharacterized protein n=1 Tax=Oryza sativa subsp. japonica TaxID=39947 RepID=Q7XHR9_ORYSJ|nr:hypothetical protein [Oryza sativa Japonica Group]